MLDSQIKLENKAIGSKLIDLLSTPDNKLLFSTKLRNMLIDSIINDYILTINYMDTYHIERKVSNIFNVMRYGQYGDIELISTFLDCDTGKNSLFSIFTECEYSSIELIKILNF
jgi:hypothetical protein